MNDSIDINELLKIKSDLICYGIKPNEVSEKIYDLEHKTKVKRTSNMGLQLLLTDNMIVSVPYNKNNPYKSKYFLYEENDKTYLTNNIIAIEVKPFPFQSPSWYDHKLTNGKCISDYIQMEGKDVLICSVTTSCCYFSKSEQCSFCALNGGNSVSEESRIDAIIEAFKYILKNDNSVKSINLTGGNLYTEDKGATQYINILKEIRSVSNIPVVVELSPPDNLALLSALYKAGATAIELNIEIWDEKIRKILMPGKSKISREHYVEAWEKSVEIFGKGNVGSGIIIGLENPNSSLEAIKAMIEVGCLPSILPFKPTEGAILENFKNCPPEDILLITNEAAKLLKEKKLSPINGPGCIGCGACTLESDMYRIS